jgi:hypothetical protein
MPGTNRCTDFLTSTMIVNDQSRSGPRQKRPEVQLNAKPLGPRDAKKSKGKIGICFLYSSRCCVLARLLSAHGIVYRAAASNSHFQNHSARCSVYNGL